MNKAELASEISAHTNHSKKMIEEVLTAFIEIVSTTVAKGERVTMVGFGTFEKKERKARQTNNPRKPGEKISIPAKKVPAFSAGKEFKDKVNH